VQKQTTLTEIQKPELTFSFSLLPTPQLKITPSIFLKKDAEARQE
jgi:hypothetical protein